MGRKPGFSAKKVGRNKKKVGRKVYFCGIKGFVMSQRDSLISLINRYKELGIDSQIDYEKFYLYSLITHSTAIEGATVTELENQLLFDEGISAKGKPLIEQMMNLDLKRAYEESIRLAKQHSPITIDLLKHLAHLVMKNTGTTYKTALGDFSSAEGDLRLVNVSAGVGGKSYLSYQKVPVRLQDFCDWLNAQRASEMTPIERYYLSFEAHYRLVTIHPWVDGNGRMARLLMNHIQFEFGLIPAKVLKEDKGDYINALIATRETNNPFIFRDFMEAEMTKTILSDIETYLKSTEEGADKPRRTQDKILSLLEMHPSYSARQIADILGITPKAVEKHLAKLKAQGVIRRVGSDRGGRWEVQ